MTASCNVEVWSHGARTHQWTLNTIDDTPGNVTPTYGLADPLIIKQQLADGERLPMTHPLPEECTINLIAPDSATYADISLGDTVVATIYAQGNLLGNAHTFAGRIAGLVAVPHDLGVLYTLTCLDYLADLAELNVGRVAYPAEQANTRFNRMTDEAGLPRFSVWGIAGVIFNAGPQLTPRAAGVTDLFSALLELLDSWYSYAFYDEFGVATGVGTGQGNLVGFRTIIRPVLDGNNQLAGYAKGWGSPLSRRIRYMPPLRLTNVAGVRTVTASAADSAPGTGAPILDGGDVEMGGTFTQDKGRGMQNVTVGSNAAGGTYTYDWRANLGTTFSPFVPGAQSISDKEMPTIVQTLDSILDASDDAGQLVASYMMPWRPDIRASYSPGVFSWQAWHVSNWLRPQLTELVTVARAAAVHNPPNREWLVGIVTATTLTLARGRPVIDIETMPNVWDHNTQANQQGATVGVARFDSPILTAVTVAQLFTRDTFTDYQLVRGS